MTDYYLIALPLAALAWWAWLRPQRGAASWLADLAPIDLAAYAERLAVWDRYTQAQMIYRHDLYLWVPGVRDERTIARREQMARERDNRHARPWGQRRVSA